MTAEDIIDMQCRICNESVYSEGNGHSHVWDAIAQLLNFYAPEMFAKIQRVLNERPSV